MNRRYRRAVAAIASAASVPAAMGFVPQPAADAATVLAVQGTLQAPRSTQNSFGNAFCEDNVCRTVNLSPGLGDAFTGAMALQTALTLTPGDVIIMGYSVGASSIYERLRAWDLFPTFAPDPERVVLIVTFGNPENKFGGQASRFPLTGLPDPIPYRALNVTMQYDSVADRPDRFGLWSQINLSFMNHFSYRDVDINDPNNLVYQDEDGATYMLIRAEVLPMLQWVDWFASDQQMAQLDSVFRPLVERDYDRPDYIEQGDGADWGSGQAPPALQGVERLMERRGLDSKIAKDTGDRVVDVDIDDDAAGPAEYEREDRGVESVAADPAEVPLVDLSEQVAELEEPTEEGADGVTTPTVSVSQATGGSDTKSTPRGENRRTERASTTA